MVPSHCLALLLVQCLAAVNGAGTEQEAAVWVNIYNTELQRLYTESVEATWAYYTNVSDHNQNVEAEKTAEMAEFTRAGAFQARKFDWKNFEDASLKRQFTKIVDIGEAVLESNDQRLLSKLRSDLMRHYGHGRYIRSTRDVISRNIVGPRRAEPDFDVPITAVRGRVRRGAEGKNTVKMYAEFVALVNKAARLNNYTDNGDYWRSWYESPTFEEDCEQLWLQLKPLYVELHAFILQRLKKKFPEDEFPVEGHFSAQYFGGLHSLVLPYPEVPDLDVTNEMRAQKYTTRKIFDQSEEFFTSLGLIPMTQAFWNKSMFTKPRGRKVVCHPSAWDFFHDDDFRIKMCTTVDMQNLMTIHHEMGHTEYQMQYKDQPVHFRNGANPGFHEAIGDTLALSVATPEHLTEIGLLRDFVDDEKGDMNFLMNQALSKVLSVPLSYLIEKWRWDVFAGKTGPDEYNRKWVEIRCKYMGLTTEGTISDDYLVAGGIIHVASHVPYIRYFIANILQFQFHEALCEAAGNTKPLHRCDIYKSLEAGQKLGDMLKLGASMPWRDAMELITGTREMSVQPLLDYFRPLQQWLEQQNEGQPKGWTDECPPK